MFLADFLYRNLKGYYLLIATAIVLTLAEVGADILSPFPLKFIFDKIANQKDAKFSSLLGFFDQHGGVISCSIGIIIVLGLLSAALSYFQLYLTSVIAKNLTRGLSTRLFNHLQYLSITWHGKQKTGDLVQHMTSNMADLEKFVADGMLDSFVGALTIFGVFVIMWLTDRQFTLFSIIIMPFLVAFVFIYTRKIKAATKQEKQAEGKVASTATEAMGKIIEIKAFTYEIPMYSRFQDRATHKFESGSLAGRLQAWLSLLVGITLVGGTAIMVWVGATVAAGSQFPLGFFTIPAKAISLGTLTVFLAYLAKLYQPMRDIAKLTILRSSASSASERIQRVLDETAEDLKRVSSASGYTGPRRLRGSISCEDVYFSYDPEKDPILNGVTLNIPAGRKVALVGLSGSGKTTLTNLIPRFYELPYNHGTIRIDGADIREYPLEVLRQNISVVLQDSILFDGTIAENIKIGQPQASDKQVKQAAMQAFIHETIINKLGGYDKKITGKDLSGGQRQRISIARAILRNAPIIIMDEPTAALDAESEAEVMRALEELAEQRTVLMITHRLSTVGKVDEIIVLKGGRIVEQGTFKSLIAKKGAFFHLWETQHPPVLEHEEGESFIHSAFGSPSQLSPKAQMLIEVDGKKVGTRQLDKEVLTVGSLMGNDIAISSLYVSRLHAKILWRKGKWLIEDAHSTPGLTYQGQKVDQHTFSPGDDPVYLSIGRPQDPTSMVALQYELIP